MLQNKPPAERFVFARNPYYYRVDEKGQQLPYADQVVFNISDSKLIPAKAARTIPTCRRATSASTTTPS